jgi:signal transduction histidine kinase/CheY-like chemotaxis protein
MRSNTSDLAVSQPVSRPHIVPARDAILTFVGVGLVLLLILAYGTGPIWIAASVVLLVACGSAYGIYRLRCAVRDTVAGHEARLAALEENAARAAAGVRDQAGSMLATVSHELRTPLTAILGFTDLLLDPNDDVTMLRSHAQTIRRNGQHLMNVLNDVLDISKIEAGTMHVEHAPFDPLQVAHDVVALLEPRAGEKGIDLGLRVDRASLPAYLDGDALRVRQILLNLVANAVKFTEVGEVTLSVRYDREERALVLTVIDTGVGIAPEQMTSLFEPFHQADASSRRRSQGVGLGLAISKRLARHMGGDIQVESEPARGSRFTLRIPAEPSSQRELAALPSARDAFETWTPRPSWKMLLVEDTLEHLKLFYGCLRRAGHSVDVCDNGGRALTKVRESEYLREPYTIVLLDLYLPDQDGLTTAREMREHGYKGPILAITADTSAETRERCIAAGCDDVYVKPLERVALLTALTRLVRGVSVGAA